MKKKLKINNFSEEDIDRIIQMAWEDRTTFDVIESQFGINQDSVIRIMRKHMKKNHLRFGEKERVVEKPNTSRFQN